MKSKTRSLAAVVTALILMLVGMAAASATDGPRCGSGGGGFFEGTVGNGNVGATGSCGVTVTDLPGGGGNASPILVIDCGYATATDDHTHWNKACGPTGYPCPAIPGEPTPHQFETVFSLNDTAAPIAAWCAGGNTPVPSAAALRDEVIRLLKPPAIGISPDTGTGLVNLKTLFWANTKSQVVLGKAKLITFPVELRVNYLRTEFDFGDHSAGTLSPDPGQPYEPAADCGQCADHFGHVYTAPGRLIITAHTYWQAQFRVGGRDWVTIPGDVTARNPATATLTIRQASATLVQPH